MGGQAEILAKIHFRGNLFFGIIFGWFNQGQGASEYVHCWTARARVHAALQRMRSTVVAGPKRARARGIHAPLNLFASSPATARHVVDLPHAPRLLRRAHLALHGTPHRPRCWHFARLSARSGPRHRQRGERLREDRGRASLPSPPAARSTKYEGCPRALALCRGRRKEVYEKDDGRPLCLAINGEVHQVGELPLRARAGWGPRRAPGARLEHGDKWVGWDADAGGDGKGGVRWCQIAW